MPKKTSRAEMYWDRSRSRWRKRVTVGGEPKVIFGRTKDEVREKHRELERQSSAGMSLDGKTTLDEYGKEWYAVKTAGLKPKSAEVYNNALAAHILPFLGGMKLSEIKPMHVKKMMAQKSELSKSSQSKILNTLSQIMASAEENGLVPKNVCTGLKAGGYTSRKKKPLTLSQQVTLAKAVAGHRCEIFTLLCLCAGLRREEALGLMWESVYLDCDAPYIDIRHTVTFDAKGRPTLSHFLKSEAARRSIPIPAVLSDALRRHKENGSESRLVVPAITTGAEMSLSAFRSMWELITGYSHMTAKRGKDGKPVKGPDGKTIREKKHYPGLIDFHVTPHLLRHTFITELCASGMDIKSIQYLAGHATVQMTLDVYTHVVHNRPSELSPYVSKAFEGIPANLSGTITGTA